MDRLTQKTKSFFAGLWQLFGKMFCFLKCSFLGSWLSFIADNFPVLPSRMKMLDQKSVKFLEFYGSIFLRPNEEHTKVVYDLRIKRKVLIVFATVVEIVKNLILIQLPMNDPMRYRFCELLISTADDEQRSLNFIIILAMSSFTVYLVLLIKLDKQKLLSWTEFLILEKRTAYATKHNLTQRSVKQLYLIYNFVMFITRCASFFYLLICYIYYARSFKLSMEKGVSSQDLLLIFLPSVLFSVQTVSLYYSQSTKNCTLFILHNLFLSMKLKKLSDDLREHEPKKKSPFYFKHLDRFQKLLSDLEDSQIYFNYCLFR